MAKAKNRELELHNSILGGDDLALSKLYDLYSETVIGLLKSWYPKAAKMDEAFFYEAINEAFLGYFKNPQTYDPERNTLQRFLEIAAERDLINILVREKKHLETKKAPEDVELEEKFWNSITKETKTADGSLLFEEAMGILNRELSTHFDNELDIKLAKLVISGERETTAFSVVLEIESLNIDKQREEVKRHKDRIKKVLERNEVEVKLKALLQ